VTELALWFAAFLASFGATWTGLDALRGERSWWLCATFVVLVLAVGIAKAGLS
jgi:hypothetical protein